MNSSRGHLDEIERWPEERWRALQWRLLRRVLRHAYRDLPFYRARFEDAGVDPGAVRTLDDLARLPLLRKSQVLHAMRESGTFPIGMEPSPAAPGSALGMSSGTEGTAFLAFPSTWRRATALALTRAYRWAGLRPGQRIMVAAPAWHSMAIQEAWVVEKLGARSVMPWGTFLPRFAGGFVDTLIDQEPTFVSMFLPMLYAMIAECQRREIPLRRAFSGVETVLVVGAPLTPRSRQRLMADLGVAQLFEGAGSSEGLIAMECSVHDAHHYFIDTCYVEILDPVTSLPLPAGRRGAVVVTSLVPHGTVYLRYDSDDVGEILEQACPCGRTWPRLEIYDRRANQFRVRDRTLLWYDVRVWLDEVPELVGIPVAVITSAGSSAHLRLVIQRPQHVDPAVLSRRLAELSQSRLGLPLRLEWAELLPVRWKGVSVIDEHDWEGDRG